MLPLFQFCEVLAGDMKSVAALSLMLTLVNVKCLIDQKMSANCLCCRHAANISSMMTSTIRRLTRDWDRIPSTTMNGLCVSETWTLR